jgi:hypothetical protein
MNFVKKHKKLYFPGFIITSFIALTLFTYLIFLKWRLPGDPSKSFIKDFPIILFILIAIFSSGVIVFKYLNGYKKGIVVLLLLVLPFSVISIFASWILGYPKIQNFKESQEFALEDYEAARIGAELAEEEKFSQSVEPEKEIEERIEDVRRRKIAKEEELDAREVIEESVKSVPVVQGEWYCNDVGCSFGEGEGVWVLAGSTRILSTIAFALPAILFGAGVYKLKKK